VILRTSATIGAPISANAMYTPSKKYGMVKSQKYREWISLNLPRIKNIQKPTKFPIEIEIIVVEGRGFTTKSDIDNIIKAICDLLVKAEIIPDDNTKFISKCEARFLPFFSTKSEATTVINIFEQE